MKRAQLEMWAGQMVVCAPEGAMMDATLTRLIEETQVGGVILFKRNCPDADSVRVLTEAMQRRAKTPLFVMIDQEGGRVRRLREDAYNLPPARELADLHPEDVQDRVGMLARRLLEIGVNCNLAPVLDVDSNPANPIIGDRAFGRDVETVWTYGKAYYDGLSARGVMGCGKHFPGHGDTDKDSHLDLPRVSHARERLMALELEPFRRAVKDGWPMLMIAHVLYDALDAENPASLSPAICTELLRDELGFDGLIIADDLEMKAVADRYDTETLVRKMVAAGVDLFPVCHTYSLALEVARTLVRLAERGDISATRLETSYTRIIAAKRRYGLIED